MGILSHNRSFSLFPPEEQEMAVDFTRRHSIAHVLINTDELELRAMRRIMVIVVILAMSVSISERKSKFTWHSVCCGWHNNRDLGAHRPGLIAASEQHILHPLVEAGLNKPKVKL